MKILKNTLWTTVGLFALAALTAKPVSADFVILDDLIVDGSACIGFDCVNGESFGFDTIRIKENNLRIKAMDTSTAASFPTQDWQLTFNDSANGGANKFSIDAISPTARTPFTIEADAQQHAIYATGSKIGLGTNTPAVELEIKDGDTPTLRLCQDGSSGFTPQTWDVAGNETNFFIRDVTNGSTLPLRIRPGASTSTVDISADEEVGINESSPDSELHVVMKSSSANVEMFTLESQNATRPARANFVNSDATGDFWRFGLTTDERFVINYQGNASAEMIITKDGDVEIEGDYFSTACTTPCAPDYVFEPDYELMPLDELEAFVQSERHLPNVPSAQEMVGRINMTQMQMTLLEKIEELTLYTLEQQKLISDLNGRLAAVEAADKKAQ